MKYLLTIIILFLPLTVSATTTYYERHILYTQGLPKEIQIKTSQSGNADAEALIINSKDLSQIKFDNITQHSTSPTELSIYPGNAKMNDYDFWKVTGYYKNKDFSIIGYTIETGGDTWLERNSLTIDIIIIIFTLAICSILIRHSLKKNHNQKSPINR